MTSSLRGSHDGSHPEKAGFEKSSAHAGNVHNHPHTYPSVALPLASGSGKQGHRDNQLGTKWHSHECAGSVCEEGSDRYVIGIIVCVADEIQRKNERALLDLSSTEYSSAGRELLSEGHGRSMTLRAPKRRRWGSLPSARMELYSFYGPIPRFRIGTPPFTARLLYYSRQYRTLPENRDTIQLNTDIGRSTMSLQIHARPDGTIVTRKRSPDIIIILSYNYCNEYERMSVLLRERRPALPKDTNILSFPQLDIPYELQWNQTGENNSVIENATPGR
ncbi:hypothetical protein ARMGADRAFT_1031479 [Armillaria gallica]|uniref:Uncharacterized protein n=1 Tax=Armillaria gallica TaxID=47427 RepID=A0A2H3D9V5_ARMGA|nr:hypothetical protein ARMGADRAFT_1031479 [Armillaria gallica]